MSRQSGYRITVTAFLPADPNNPASMVAAGQRIEALDAALTQAGFIAVQRRQKLYLSTEVADGAGQLPMPQTATEEGDPAAAGAERMSAVGIGKVSGGDASMPSARRRTQAAE